MNYVILFFFINILFIKEARERTKSISSAQQGAFYCRACLLGVLKHELTEPFPGSIVTYKKNFTSLK